MSIAAGTRPDLGEGPGAAKQSPHLLRSGVALPTQTALEKLAVCDFKVDGGEQPPPHLTDLSP